MQLRWDVCACDGQPDDEGEQNDHDGQANDGRGDEAVYLLVEIVFFIR